MGVAPEDLTAEHLVDALEALQSDTELVTVRKRLPPDEPAIGIRMGAAVRAQSFSIAARLAADPDPVVHNAVGIFLKHAGERDREALHSFLEERAASMPRAALRLATEKLSPADRARYRG